MTGRTVAWPAAGTSPADELVIATQRAGWSGARGDWVILPLNDDKSLWAVVAADREGMRRARDVMKAFVGPASGALRAGIEQATLRTDGERIVLVSDVDVFDPDEFRSAVERLVTVRASSPVVSSEIPASLSQKIRDFRLAISDEDARRSERQLALLRSDGRLSAQNLNFLEVELLGRFGRWAELRALPWFTQLGRIPRPRSVTDLMLESIWWVDFVSGSYDSPATALERYAELSSELYGLFDAVEVPGSSASRRVVALRALQQGSEQRLDRIRDSSAGADRAWIDQLLRPSDPTAGLDPLDRARRMLEDGRFVEVVELAERLQEEPRLVELAVRAAAEIESTELAARVQPLLDARSRVELPDTPGFRRALDRVAELAARDCTSWPEWLDRVAAHQPWQDAAEVVRHGSEDWPTDGLRVGARAVQASEALEAALGGVNRYQVQQAMDLLCGLAADLADAPAASRFVDTVLYALLDETPTEILGSAFLGLVQAVLRVGPSRTRYGDLLDVCIAVEQIFEARVLLPVAMDLLDEIAMHATPDPDKRRELATVAYNGFRAQASRGHITLADALIAESLLDELGLPGAAGLRPQADGSDDRDGSEPDPWRVLSGKTVLLYTLLDGLGARFGSRVKAFCPDAAVETVDDRVASSALAAAVMRADFVMVDTRHAKHAATKAIDDLMPRAQQLLPDGKGVSSFLRCLLERLNDSVSA